MTAAEIGLLMGSLGDGAILVETHISWVILVDDALQGAGPMAYKLKKPLKFSFLDFSTLQNRQYYCERELVLNRRLAADVYLQVLPVCRVGNAIALGGPGEVIDYALQMRRLDAAMEMDRLLAQGEVPQAYMGILARKIADFHAAAVVVRDASLASFQSYQADFNDLLQQEGPIRQFLGEAALAQVQLVAAFSDQFLERHATRIADRLQAGLVRDVHGDLHARNIFAYPEPVVFDCIEFNDHFRQIDVLNELAFFCMDLDAMGFEGHSEAFLEAYLAHFPAMETAEDRLLFWWFKCYRANVRAKVLLLRCAQQERAAPEDKAEISGYLQHMQDYARAISAAEQF